MLVRMYNTVIHNYAIIYATIIKLLNKMNNQFILCLKLNTIWFLRTETKSVSLQTFSEASPIISTKHQRQQVCLERSHFHEQVNNSIVINFQ